MRIPIKIIVTSVGLLYGGITTRIIHDQKEQIDILEKKLKKQKKKAKRYKEDLKKPIYRRSVLPRNAKPISKQKPQYPIGFA